MSSMRRTNVLRRLEALETSHKTGEIEHEQWYEAYHRMQARASRKVREFITKALADIGEPVTEDAGKLVNLPGLLTSRLIAYHEAWLASAPDTPEQAAKDEETCKRPVRKRTPNEWKPGPDWWPRL